MHKVSDVVMPTNAPGGDALIGRGVVIEEGPDEEALLLAHPQHAARHHLALDRVDFRLERFVLRGAVQQPRTTAKHFSSCHCQESSVRR